MSILNPNDKVTSIVWGNKEETVTQGFGTYNPGTAGMYDYASSVGLPAGTHPGLDIGMERGTPIFAATDGTVQQAGFSDSFRPKPVWIKQDDGKTAIYGHLWTDSVSVGEHVKAGQQLGTSGEQTTRGTMNPDGTGPHLHFELRDENGKAIDPAPELTQTGDVTIDNPLMNHITIIAGVGIAALLILVLFR